MAEITRILNAPLATNIPRQFFFAITTTASTCCLVQKFQLKPGLHIGRKNRKHILENMFFKLCSYGLVSIW